VFYCFWDSNALSDYSLVPYLSSEKKTSAIGSSKGKILGFEYGVLRLEKCGV